MHISPRYLRSLFTGQEKLSRYILRRRLEECATRLENPLFSTLPVTAIAFNMGFNSAGHFSRSFKKHYGVSPREYRRQHLKEASEKQEEVGRFRPG